VVIIYVPATVLNGQSHEIFWGLFTLLSTVGLGKIRIAAGFSNFHKLDLLYYTYTELTRLMFTGVFLQISVIGDFSTIFRTIPTATSVIINSWIIPTGKIQNTVMSATCL
jgi:hypothetical protein